MATIITKVTNNLTVAIPLQVPGFDRNHPVTIGASATVDLLKVMTDDQLLASQGQIAAMVASGSLTSVTTASDAGLGNLVPQAAVVAVDAVAAAGDPPTQAEFNVVVTLVNELKAKLNAISGN